MVEGMGGAAKPVCGPNLVSKGGPFLIHTGGATSTSLIKSSGNAECGSFWSGVECKVCGVSRISDRDLRRRGTRWRSEGARRQGSIGRWQGPASPIIRSLYGSLSGIESLTSSARLEVLRIAALEVDLPW